MQKTYRAKEFLVQANNSFALNRFKDNNTALEFVNLLYQAGAMDVLVSGVRNYKSASQIDADILAVKLPREKVKRDSLFKIYNKEVAREGFEIEKDTGQPEITFWWD